LQAIPRGGMDFQNWRSALVEEKSPEELPAYVNWKLL
jgi:hypothetical protein